MLKHVRNDWKRQHDEVIIASPVGDRNSLSTWLQEGCFSQILTHYIAKEIWFSSDQSLTLNSNSENLNMSDMFYWFVKSYIGGPM